MRIIATGATDQSTVIRILGNDGTPQTSVNSATAGLALSYRREGGASVALTVSDLASAVAVHADGGIFHIGSGYYRVDVPDAAWINGTSGVLIFGSATGMVVVGAYHPVLTSTPLSAIASAVVTAMDIDSTQLAKLDGIATTTNAVQSSLALGVTVATNNDKSGYLLGPTGLNAISKILSGPRSGWLFPQWMMFAALRLGRSRKVKSTGAISIYDAATQNTVIYTMTTSDTGTEQNVGPPP